MLLRAVILAILAFAQYPLLACSAVACINGGSELRRAFVVVVRHEGRPLAGATVKVTSSSGDIVRFSGTTANDGSVRVAGLEPGDYWMDAELLGINAAYHCFHISKRSGWRAKGRMTYEWGDFATSTRKVIGALVDSQPGTGGTPLWNLIHRVRYPVVGSALKLHNPLSGVVLTAKSDETGSFAFENVPDGLYVLHIEGGRSNRDFEAVDKLIRVTSKAADNRLVLIKSDAGGGSCGGTSLELTTAR